MAKVKKQDDDDAVRTFSDDTPDDEAMDDRRGRHSDEDDDTEPPLPPDPTKTVEYWKDKAYAAERAKTEIADGYKEKINQLQDEKKRTLINADAALKVVFGGKKQVSMFEMTKLVSGHLKK